MLAVVCAALGLGPPSSPAHDTVAAEWPRTTEAVRAPGTSNATVADAMHADLAARGVAGAAGCVEAGRWLLESSAGDDSALDARRGAAIMARYVARAECSPPSFWTLFALAALNHAARDDARAAELLGRAGELAVREGLPATTIALTRGLTGHALQSAGEVAPARAIFESLLGAPGESGHARAHLGRIALRSDGIDAALDVWMRHPGGLAAATATIVEEVDALWRADPDRSYRLADAALQRIDRAVGATPSGALATARARLAARTRENAR